ncbi:unnamed protein product [Debaryomyces tyrocola]|nr:unnamed protein product [Debaryomyces tyrocola]
MGNIASTTLSGSRIQKNIDTEYTNAVTKPRTTVPKIARGMRILDREMPNSSTICVAESIPT